MLNFWLSHDNRVAIPPGNFFVWSAGADGSPLRVQWGREQFCYSPYLFLDHVKTGLLRITLSVPKPFARPDFLLIASSLLSVGELTSYRHHGGGGEPSSVLLFLLTRPPGYLPCWPVPPGVPRDQALSFLHSCGEDPAAWGPYCDWLADRGHDSYAERLRPACPFSHAPA